MRSIETTILKQATCGRCAHYHMATSTCRANAPQPRMVPVSASQADESVLWPMVAKDEWCGQFSGKGVETK